ncbi:MAG: helix-turn-helix transcriptional regulator [Subdoligranulum sp.]
MTLGQQIASARREKGMTQEMLAEQLGVTRQAVAKEWKQGKLCPGTANLFAAPENCWVSRRKRAALEEKTETREPDVQEKAETAGSLTCKTNVGTDCGNGDFAMVCSAICWAWRGDWIVDTSVHFNKRTLFYSGGKSGASQRLQKQQQGGSCSRSGSNAAGGTFMVHCFCGICKLPKYSDVERSPQRCMAAIPHGCRMDAALRNNGKWCLYAAGGPAFRPGEYNRISCLPQWRDQ